MLNRRLTDAELELMLILWDVGETSVRDLLKQYPESSRPAYTTVSTIVRIMEQKGFVLARKDGKTHRYRPLVTKKDYEALAVNAMVEQVFANKPSNLVRRLLDSKNLSVDELADIKRMFSDEAVR